MEDLTVEQRHQFYEARRDSIVCVQRSDGYYGGGVFVEVASKQLVLTSAHIVVGHDADLMIVCADKRSFAARTSNVSRALDLALLEVLEKPEDGFQCLELYDGELIRGAEIYFIGHPGMQKFTYNIGRIACISRTCGAIYSNEFMLSVAPPFPEVNDTSLIDDFRGLAPSLKLVTGRNVHGGGRSGGTGAPFLNGSGRIIGLYSFSYRDEDYAVQVAEIQQVLEMFKAEEAKCEAESEANVKEKRTKRKRKRKKKRTEAKHEAESEAESEADGKEKRTKRKRKEKN